MKRRRMVGDPAMRTARTARRPRVGIFGGTFDPPHRGHLAIALAAVRQLGLDRLYFVPARISPHKQGTRPTAASHRAAMVRLLVGQHPAFRLSLAEIRRRKVSFTVDTLRAFRKRFPRAEFVLIIGGDNLRKFRRWRNPREIRRLATLAVYPRARASRSTGTERIPGGIHRLRGRLLDISSTEVRQRRRPAGWSAQLPPAVASYITRHRLYARRGQRTTHS